MFKKIVWRHTKIFAIIVIVVAIFELIGTGLELVWSNIFLVAGVFYAIIVFVEKILDIFASWIVHGRPLFFRDLFSEEAFEERRTAFFRTAFSNYPLSVRRRRKIFWLSVFGGGLFSLLILALIS